MFSNLMFSQNIENNNSIVTEAKKIETIKTPFSVVLDESLNAIKIDIAKEEDIKLFIFPKDNNQNSFLNLKVFKNGQVTEDINITQKFQKEFDYEKADSLILKAKGKFLVKASKLEIIADMQINIPDENVQNSDEISQNQDKGIEESGYGNKEEVVEEVISAKDKEAFKKATGAVEITNKNQDEKLEENNTIQLVYDDSFEKKEFDQNLKKEIQKEDLNKIVKPLDDISKNEVNVKKAENIKLVKPQVEELEDEKIKNEIKKEPLEIALPKEIKRDIPKANEFESEIEKPLKDDFDKKEIKLKEPKIAVKDIDKKIDSKLIEAESKSDLKQIVSNDTIKKPSIKKIVKEASIAAETTIYFASPKIKHSSLGIKSPLIKKIDNVEVKNENFSQNRPNIKSVEDEVLKSEKIKGVDVAFSKSDNLNLNKPVISKSENFSSPKIGGVSLKVEKNVEVEKPKIEKSSISSPKIVQKVSPPLINSSLKENAPKISSSLDNKIEPKGVPSKVTGFLDVYVLKEGNPTVGWISVIDERTNKVVANGDTFYKNPATFTLPIGKYTVVIVDKKVVPPLIEKIYSVEVKGGERAVAKSTFANGTLKVAVMKNSIPTSTAYVKIYDAKTNQKIIDENTYNNNPIVVKLPFGKYYAVVEDYSLRPSQHIILKDIEIKSKGVILKSVNFKEGKLKITTLNNEEPIGARYEIFLPNSYKKIKSGFTDPNSGEALIKLAAGNYEVRVSHRSSVSKIVKKFTNVNIQNDKTKELVVVFREGKLKVISTRGGEPLYTNVSIYKPGSDKRLYFDFTSRDKGEVTMNLPVGFYDVVVRDHNIKRFFKRIHIRENQTKIIHAKF